MASPYEPGESPGNDDIVVSKVRRLDDDLAVAHVDFSIGISLRSIWISGLSESQPTVSWPRSTRGFPIVLADPELRARIDALVLEAVAAA